MALYLYDPFWIVKSRIVEDDGFRDMRKIKFRIRNTKNNTWIHGPHEESKLDGVNLFGETIIFGELLLGVSLDELKDIVALQFTGFEDKNGREIFEGDILQDEDGERSNVVFCHGCFMLVNGRLLAFPQPPSDMEVVGNIYDNPLMS